MNQEQINKPFSIPRQLIFCIKNKTTRGGVFQLDKRKNQNTRGTKSQINQRIGGTRIRKNCRSFYLPYFIDRMKIFCLEGGTEREKAFFSTLDSHKA